MKSEATPFATEMFRLVGAVIAIMLGTPEGSMRLVRPWLRINKNRASARHVVFFN